MQGTCGRAWPLRQEAGIDVQEIWPPMAWPGTEEAGQLAGPGGLGVREVPADLSLSASPHAVCPQWGPSPFWVLHQTR